MKPPSRWISSSATTGPSSEGMCAGHDGFRNAGGRQGLLVPQIRRSDGKIDLARSELKAEMGSLRKEPRLEALAGKK